MPLKNFIYFPKQEDLERNGFQLEKDHGYFSVEAVERDLAWCAFQMGFISSDSNDDFNFWKNVSLPIQDEYRFLRKNYHKAWVYYVLFLRLLTLRNPFKELSALLKTKDVKRVDYAQNYFEYKAYNTFTSTLVKSNPLVSVIIPTLNRYKHLKDVLRDLEKQSYKNFEVIVVDQTDDFKAEAYNHWNLDLYYWHQKEKALWKARNSAIKKAKGDYILLYDDDSLIEADWIFHHLKTLDFFKADISSGVSMSVIGGKPPKHYQYFRWSDQLDTGNVMIKKAVFKTTGLFDRQFEKQRMGDGEFGLRAYLAGFKNISNPKAKRVHLKVSQGGLRQMGSWDAFRTSKLFAPKPIPSVLYFTRKYFGNRASFNFILINVLPSVIPMKYKSNKILKLIAFLMFPIVLPLIIVQVCLSWKQSTIKLKQGSLIDALDD